MAVLVLVCRAVAKLAAWAVHLFPCSSSRLHSFAAPDHPISPAAWTRPSQTSEHTRTRTASSLSSSRDSGQTVSWNQSTRRGPLLRTPTAPFFPEAKGDGDLVSYRPLPEFAFFLSTTSLLPKRDKAVFPHTSAARNCPSQLQDPRHSIRPISPRDD